MNGRTDRKGRHVVAVPSGLTLGGLAARAMRQRTRLARMPGRSGRALYVHRAAASIAFSGPEAGPERMVTAKFVMLDDQSTRVPTPPSRGEVRYAGRSINARYSHTAVAAASAVISA